MSSMKASSPLCRLALGCAGAFCCIVACGGDPFVAGDGGSSPGADAAACVTPPTATGDEADFCAVETKLYTKCGDCEACRQSDLNDCEALGDDLSAAFKSSLDTCQDDIACGDYSTYGSDPCVAAALASSAKSTAQTTAANAYCAKCGPIANGGASASCVTSFFQPPLPDGGSAGPGYLVLLSSDAIVTQIATTCAGGCNGTYELCAVTEFCKNQAPDACKTGYCGK